MQKRWDAQQSIEGSCGSVVLTVMLALIATTGDYIQATGYAMQLRDRERERERERQVERDIGALPRLSSVVDLLLTPAARRVAIIRACLPLSSRCPLNVHARAHAERKEMRRRRRRRRRGRSCLAWSKPK